MARPKGSTNKKKEVVAEVVPEVVETKVVVEDKTFDKVDSKCKEFICDHPKSLHYGPSKDWCNSQGCKCQAFKA